ncbi:hypothetical protein [Actinomadura miaoliensis]|uniref:hypothetical protein n=1 Tax=Actinomadura miaoliensis TaxID=430685 RepID=UPI003CD08F14
MLIVDGGSPDDNAEVVKQFVGDPRVHGRSEAPTPAPLHALGPSPVITGDVLGERAAGWAACQPRVAVSMTNR